jgi:hypothetical protein
MLECSLLASSMQVFFSLSLLSTIHALASLQRSQLRSPPQRS